MTIAIRVELREDWGGNCPGVRVMAKTFGRHPTQYEVARLTPERRTADVCITKDQDLYFEVESYSVAVLEGRQEHRGFIAPTPYAQPLSGAKP